jgi:hypothetical protein
MAIKDDMEDVQEAVINELITENGITNTLADGQVTPAKLSQAYLPLTAQGHIIISNIPTSSAGLTSGTIYSDGGTLKIV